MRILFVAEGRYPDFSGGTETVIHHLTHELAGHAHDVYTLTRKPQPGAPDYEIDGKIHVHRYPGPPVGSRLYRLYPVSSFLEARRCFVGLCEKTHFDAIVFNHPFSAWSILSTAASKNSKRIYMLHSASHLELRMAAPCEGMLWDTALRVPMACVKHIERSVIRKCDHIITLSQYMRDQVASLCDEAIDRVEIISGGVDACLFRPVGGAEEKIRLREALGIPRDALGLFAAKRLYRGVGLENLVDAVGLLLAKEPGLNVCLLIAGEGPSRGQLESRISALRLGNVVRLLGNVPHEKIASYFRCADLFISTRPEPFGLAMLEALACQLPVLSVPAGGGIEILQGLSKKLLFQNSSSKAMADLILNFVNSPQELAALRQACGRYVRDNYAWSIAANKVENLLARRDVA